MTRYFSGDAHVERLARGVMDCSLPKPEWTHAAHFATALWMLRQRPDLQPEVDMPGMIRRYNAATGVLNTDSSGYHETITQASIIAARGFLALQPTAQALHETVDRLMLTRLGESRWLLAHWSQERLFSVEARRRWVDPDLQPLAGWA